MAMESRGLHTFSGKIGSSEPWRNAAVSMMLVWIAVTVGLIVGWSWKPRWIGFLDVAMKSKSRFAWSTPLKFAAKRLWLALTALTAFQMLKQFWSKFKHKKWAQSPLQKTFEKSISSISSMQPVVTMDDFKNLCLLLECQDGGPAWQMLMEKSIPNMTYQSWRREPLAGLTEYRSRTVFEDASPEIVRDFFWDDEFRLVWDDMLISAETLEECTKTGTAIVHWIRKFPFFCSNREYIIGRRIWESEGTYFCITKGVPYSSVPRRNKPRRVDIYYSSWSLRAVGSSKDEGKLTACEVMLFHHEDMGIPREIAKFGIRQGMWGCVKNMEPGLRKYQAMRNSRTPLSRSALSAQITTKIPASFFKDFGLSSLELGVKDNDQKAKNPALWRWLIVGGAIALACGLDKGVVSKVVVFGVARRLGKLGRRL